jgi:hypothetical protein
LPPAGFRDKKEEQIRNLEAQVNNATLHAYQLLFLIT